MAPGGGSQAAPSGMAEVSEDDHLQAAEEVRLLPAAGADPLCCL